MKVAHPASPASGRFVLRLPRELHSRLKQAARESGKSLNQLCVELLSAKLDGAPAVALPTGEEVCGINVSELAEKWKYPVAGIVLFGSAARRESWDTSDVDLLIVLDRGVPLTRDLYDQWERVAAPAAAGRTVSPMLAVLPDEPEDAGGLWYEVALDGIVLWDADLKVSRFLAKLRRRIVEGTIVRRYSHGQPYWIRKDDAA